MKLQPLDIVVVDGLWYMPHHWLIRWRSLDPGVHCLTVLGESAVCYSPEFLGIVFRQLDHYRGRKITIHRYRGDLDMTTLLNACRHNYRNSRGYDFRQWFGFLTGICLKKWVDASKMWTCSEFPYWPFQDSHRITPKDELLPLPRMFRYHPDFDTIFDGVWQ